MSVSISAPVQRVWQAAIAVFLCMSVAQPAAAALGRPRYAAILLDPRTSEVLYSNAADEPRHPASITKVMTLFLAFDALVAGRLRLNDPIVMSRHAASQRPSKLGLAPGRSITLDDAIHIITVKSANDVAVALAERIGGSETAFAALMTRKARALGMTNTTFTNASGLADPGNVTTARDIATLSAALLKAHPSYYSYFGQQAFKYESRSYTNHNRLLGKLTGLDGIKTGFTNDAGFTLAASAVRNGQRLITVVLGEPSIAARNRDVTALLDAGFSVLERRRNGEQTSVAFNLPTLNHPALRLAGDGDQGSRGDISEVRKRVAEPSRPISSRPAARSGGKSTHKAVAGAASKKQNGASGSKTRSAGKDGKTAAKGSAKSASVIKSGKSGKAATATARTSRSAGESKASASAAAKSAAGKKSASTAKTREREAAAEEGRAGAGKAERKRS